MFEAIVSFLIVCAVFLQIIAVVFLLRGFMTALCGRDFAGQSVSLYSIVLSSILLILAGLVLMGTMMIGAFI